MSSSVTVCIPVLRRYDMLQKLVESLGASTLRPEAIFIIDNGRSADRLSRATETTSLPVFTYVPKKPMGVAESWNWFLDNVPEERIISNDDVTFAPASLEKIVSRKSAVCSKCGSSNVIRDTDQDHPGIGHCTACGDCYITDEPSDLVWASGFSCFLIRDSCVAKLGKFDETISPGYGYYEDDDYLQRLDGRGTLPRKASAENVDCGVVHSKSSTLKSASHEELLDHHRKFKIAQANYMRKWGLTSL